MFYSSSGSESNDTNVRMVRRYWDLLGQPERKVIIGRLNAYHGSTMAGAPARWASQRSTKLHEASQGSMGLPKAPQASMRLHKAPWGFTRLHEA